MTAEFFCQIGQHWLPVSQRAADRNGRGCCLRCEAKRTPPVRAVNPAAPLTRRA